MFKGRPWDLIIKSAKWDPVGIEYESQDMGVFFRESLTH